MMMRFVLLTMACFSGAAFAEAESLFETSKTGKLLCVSPVDDNKTCGSISGYERMGDGSVISSDAMQLRDNPEIRVTLHMPSVINGNRLCQKMQPNQFKSAVFTRDGVVINGEDDARLRDYMISKLRIIMGRSFCMSLSGDGPLYVADYELDGAIMPTLQARVRLISADEGYKLRTLD